MLEAMRNAAQGIVGKAIMTVVMGLIIVSFAIWGVGDMLRGFTANDRRHRRRGDDLAPRNSAPPMTERSSNISAGCASPLTNAQAHASGSTAGAAAADQRRGARRQARTLGLAISDDACAG